MYSITKTFQALALSVAAFMALCSCGGRHEGCLISGRVTAEPYRAAVFQTAGGQVIDSVAIASNAFRFEVDGKIAEPYLNIVKLVNLSDPEDYVEIPVGIENGEVRISYGESFRTGGTPLNDNVMLFYSGLSQLTDQVTSPDRKVAIENIADEFSHYYLQSISFNYNNPLGEYIYSYYGSHLTGEDKDKAIQALNK